VGLVSSTSLIHEADLETDVDAIPRHGRQRRFAFLAIHMAALFVDRFVPFGSPTCSCR
jgi:hypothetical protein